MKIARRAHGFTLVELIVTIVLIGAIGGMLSLQLRPALQSYLAVGRRANLVNQADSALHRIVGDVHAAVPNSLRLASGLPPGDQCVEVVPTKAGGRYRTAADIDTTVDSQAFDPSQPGKAFDVMTDQGNVAQGDIFVVGNENGGDVYDGTNRAPISAITTPAAAAGRYRIALDRAAPFASSYEAGRFLVVAQAEQVVGYACVGAGRNADGTGTGTLRRVVRAFGAAQCPYNADSPVLATKVADCGFVYRENEGVTQQSGYLQLRLGLADGAETATLTMGAHVENVP